MTGTITSVKLDRGFAFIKPDEPGSADVFLHVHALLDLEWNERLMEMRVAYDVESSPRGFRAKNVRAVD